MKLTTLSTAAIFALAACQSPAPNQTTATNATIFNDTLRQQISAIAARSGGTVGVAVKNLDTGDTMTLNNEPVYPMQSTFKFPIAMTILHQVDQKKLQLNQKIFIDKKWMADTATHSPLRDAHPKGDVEQTIAQLVQYAVSESDNIACDLLIDLAGGEAVINDHIHSIGVDQIAIVASEAKMSTAWNIQYTNWTAPISYIQLLEHLNKGTALQKPTNDFLWKTMLETSTGPKRLKGLLPEGTQVAHKTGTSGTKDGIAAATNDAGIIMLPNGQKLAIAVFVMNSKGDQTLRELTIAEIAKAAYDQAVR